MSTSGEGGIGTLKGGNVAMFIHDCIIAPLMYLIVPTLFVELLIGARNKKFVLLSLIAMTCYSIYIVYCFIIWKKIFFIKEGKTYDEIWGCSYYTALCYYI